MLTCETEPEDDSGELTLVSGEGILESGADEEFGTQMYQANDALSRRTLISRFTIVLQKQLSSVPELFSCAVPHCPEVFILLTLECDAVAPVV